MNLLKAKGWWDALRKYVAQAALLMQTIAQIHQLPRERKALLWDLYWDASAVQLEQRER